MSKNYFHAIATLIGTIIGVGIFALPYVVSRSGLIAFFICLPVLGAVQYFLHKLYAEIILSTKTKHRIPGYVARYFGSSGKQLALIIILLSGYGALLAYLITGGIFLHQLLSPSLGGNLFIYTSILYALEIFVVLIGLRLIASVELLMTGLLFLAVALIVWRGWNFISLDNYILVPSLNNWRAVFLPYGPVLFAVAGGSAIPAVCKLLAHKKDNIKSAIFWGTVIPIVITLVFVTFIVGLTGPETSADTLVGLSLVLTDGVITFALLFGILSIVTSFLVVAQAVREVFWWDFKMNKNIAWALSCFTPFILYLLGLQNLTHVVSLAGAVSGGLIGLIMIWLIFRVKAKRELKPAIDNPMTKALAWLLSLLFILGLIYEVWPFFV